MVAHLVGRLTHPEASLSFLGQVLGGVHDLGEILLRLIEATVLEMVNTRGIQQIVVNRLQLRAFLLHRLKTAEGFIVFLRVEQQINRHLFGFGLALRIGMLGDKVVKQANGLIEGVSARNETQSGIVKQGLFGKFDIEARGIGSKEGTTGIFQLICFGVTRS